MYPRESTYRKEGSKRFLIDKYGKLQYGDIVQRSAEEVSNNKKCWWVYKYIINYRPINWAKRRDY